VEASKNNSMNKFKKQIAFVLAFVMVFSLLPVTAFGAARAPGDVPELPITDYNRRAYVYQGGREGRFLRSVRFEANDFGAPGVESFISVARVRLYPYRVRPYPLYAYTRFRTTSGTALRVDQANLPENIRRAVPSGYFREYAQVFAFQQSGYVPGYGHALSVALIQDRGYGRWAWLVVEVNGTVPGWFNARVDLPIAYQTEIGQWASGRDPLQFQIYGRFSGRFTQRIDMVLARFERPEAFRVQYYGGPVPTFTGEVTLPGRIRVIEDVVSAFDNAIWRVDFRLPRGFSWGTAPRNISASSSDLGSRLGYLRVGGGGSGAYVYVGGYRQTGIVPYTSWAIHRNNNYRFPAVTLPVNGAPNQIVSDGGNAQVWTFDMPDLDGRVGGNQDQDSFSVAFQTGRHNNSFRGPGRIEVGHYRAPLTIIAERAARAGNVAVEVIIHRWDPDAGWLAVASEAVVVANYVTTGNIQVDVYGSVPELISGQREWRWQRGTGAQGVYENVIQSTPAVLRPRAEEHMTATVRVRETAIDTFNFGGASELAFMFDEGVYVLGARVWTNEVFRHEAYRNAGIGLRDDQRTGPSHYDFRFFDNTTSWRGSHEVQIRPDSVSMRLTRDERDRYANRLGEVRVTFFLSVQPGFEALIGNEIEVHVGGRAVGGIVDSVVVATVVDPIHISTTNIIIDHTLAALGFVPPTQINDITIYETEAGALRGGSELFITIEDQFGITNEDLTLLVGRVRAEGGDGLSINPRITRQAGGVVIEIDRESLADGGRIILEDVRVTGRVIVGLQYSVVVSGSAVGANVWDIDNPDFSSRFISDMGRRTPHGLFDEAAYATPAFVFTADDIFDGGLIPTPTPVVTPTPTPQPVWTPPAPAVFASNTPWTSVSLAAHHGVPVGHALTIMQPPVFRAFASVDRPDEFVVSYVAIRVMADLLGLNVSWNQAARSATFSDDRSNVVVFTHNSPVAFVTRAGQSTQPVQIALPIAITDLHPQGGVLQADARIYNDMMFVPVRFFEAHLDFWPVGVSWDTPAPGSITVTPRAR
jgi:hypothetical protein